MEKKNEFVTTIGFNQHDPVHRRAVEILNGMKRGKADYIAKAVMFYKEAAQNGGMDRPAALDYTQLKEYILEIIAEHEKNTELSGMQGSRKAVSEKPMSMNEMEFGGIMTSLQSFRNG